MTRISVGSRITVLLLCMSALSLRIISSSFEVWNFFQNSLFFSIGFDLHGQSIPLYLPSLMDSCEQVHRYAFPFPMSCSAYW